MRLYAWFGVLYFGIKRNGIGPVPLVVGHLAWYSSYTRLPSHPHKNKTANNAAAKTERPMCMSENGLCFMRGV